MKTFEITFITYNPKKRMIETVKADSRGDAEFKICSDFNVYTILNVVEKING